jgi:putative Holliday junction resolvase
MTNTDASVLQPVELKNLMTGKTRLIGLDVGERRVGISVSDTAWSIASPIEVWDMKHQPLQHFKKILDVYNLQWRQPIVGFVVGLPLSLYGEIGPQAEKVQKFCDRVLKPLGYPIVYWDERMSTHGAGRALTEADMSRRQKSEVIDKMAAVFILQGVLDFVKTVSHSK